mmetsp:Transcript_12902/g.24403  ORF Transcript_12902/g.24403 Transcript_12902/m.24403 type:complete len:948 (-) Transcript_12902:342-3185(-)|eukprot:CAMPEP_0197473552 /NCGR_PEP_ID=MMETSP1309-20131121/4942_1 /TAXON_ID=464262 /ORGANISM="Genus nov. species nov., Strain RCC998" /LENGTH=947 /DNA_ID=CAMNT_0043012735 /DNA_START=296 /DNA_END=3139 /DNA_ORIENTATION=-
MESPKEASKRKRTEHGLEELKSLAQEKLNLPEGNVAAASAKKLIEECLPDLLKATESAGVKVDSSAQRKSLQLWTSCFLYIAKRVRLSSSNSSNSSSSSSGEKNNAAAGDGKKQAPDVERSFTITQLLRASNISYVEFAREMRHILARVKTKIADACGENGDGNALESALEMSELSMDFCHMSALFSKYKDKFQHLFTSESGATIPNLSPSKNSALPEGRDWETDAWFKLGWLTFITCKAKLLPKFADLVSCASLLVCVLNFLLAHVPPSRLRKPLNDAVAYPVRTATGATYTLGCVAFLMHAHLQDAQRLMPKVDDLLNELLSKDPVIERYDLVVDAVIMTGCGNYKGLLAVGAADRQLEIMDKIYEKAYRLNGEIDARDFAQTASNSAMGNSNKMTPRLNKSSPLNTQLNNNGSIKLAENRSWPSPFRRISVPQSPALLNRAVPSTPISEAMAASQWLRKAVSQHIDRNSPKLNRIFTLCSKKSKDIKEKIEKYVQELADKILPAVGSPLGKRAKPHGNSFTSEAEKRKNEGIALYFHILEAMLLAEEKRNGSEVLMSLLLNKTLHVSMVAFAFEVLSDCYKMTALSFPTVLNRLDISAFDLCKVIEPLVRSEVNLNLPKEVKKHLYAIEETSLECLSWKPGSTFYKHMIEARSPTGKGDSEGDNSSSAFQKVNPLPKCFGRPETRIADSNSSTSSSPSEKTLEEFFKKVAKLCTFRLIDLCNRLERDCMFKKKNGDLVDSAMILEQVVSIVEYVIYEQTRLLYNRHVDQIILSSLYGVCKVNQIGVTFRDIVHHYSKQTQCKQEVYRAVVLKQSYPELHVEECGDIIGFYNKVFIPLVQNELINQQPVKALNTDKTQSASDGNESPRTPTMAQRNVFATMMPDYKKQQYLLASPSSHSVFTFIGVPTEPYETPSKRLKTINNKLAKPGLSLQKNGSVAHSTHSN